MRSDSRPKIALFGTFGSGNLGNDCTLHAMVWNLRRFVPNVDLTCICSGPDEIAARYNISTFPIRTSVAIRKMLKVPPVKSNPVTDLLRWLLKISQEPYRWYKSMRALKDSDMLIVTGLGMLGDFGITPFGLHYDILRWSIIAKLCRCKLLFVSVGVGPIRNWLSRRFVKAALAFADYRSYRDAFSMNYLAGIGFNTANDRVYPDLAFSLPAAMLPGNRNGANDRPVIGVGLMNYYSRQNLTVKDETIYKSYTASIAKFVIALLERDYIVRLLIGDVVYDDDVRTEIRKLVEDHGWSYADGHVIDEPASSVPEILSQLAATDLVVASRFHNLLLALLLAKPVVAISYHEKIVELLKDAGLTQFCQDIEDLDIENLIGQFSELKDGPEGRRHRAGIQQRTDAYRRELDEQYSQIFGDVASAKSEIVVPSEPGLEPRSQ
jgi:polysaccharide pyruvyl transferase WcaK-like protein